MGMNFYYGLVDKENNGYGFIEETDSRVTDDMIKLTAQEHSELLSGQSQGQEIVYYEGRVFNAESGRFYVDKSGWHKKSDEEKQKMKRQELDMYTLTPADVERALYKAKGMDFEDLKALIAEKLPEIDIKALGIEFRAKDFYRGAEINGVRLFDVVGNLLGYTSDDMDYLFENKELPNVV